MEPLNYPTLFIFFFIISLTACNSANAICVPINSTSPTPSHTSHASPISHPVDTPKPILHPVDTPKPIPHPVDTPKSIPHPVDTPKPIPHPIDTPKPIPHPVDTPKSNPLPQPASNPTFDTPKSNPLPQPASNPTLTSSKSMLPMFPHLLETFPHLLHTDDAPIKKICASTDYPEDCISSIIPFFGGKTDLCSVVELAIKAATVHTKLAIAAATKIATSPGIAPDLVSIIGDCKDSYEDALDNFQKAMDALSLRDVGTMNSMLSAAITDFSDNDDSLAGKGSSTLLLEFNVKLTRMTSNCLAITSLIK